MMTRADLQALRARYREMNNAHYEGCDPDLDPNEWPYPDYKKLHSFKEHLAMLSEIRIGPSPVFWYAGKDGKPKGEETKEDLASLAAQGCPGVRG